MQPLQASRRDTSLDIPLWSLTVAGLQKDRGTAQKHFLDHNITHSRVLSASPRITTTASRGTHRTGTDSGDVGSSLSRLICPPRDCHGVGSMSWAASLAPISGSCRTCFGREASLGRLLDGYPSGPRQMISHM